MFARVLRVVCSSISVKESPQCAFYACLSPPMERHFYNTQNFSDDFSCFSLKHSQSSLNLGDFSMISAMCAVQGCIILRATVDFRGTKLIVQTLDRDVEIKLTNLKAVDRETESD